MPFVEWIALVLAVLILLEFLVLVFAPQTLLSVGKVMADYTYSLMVFYVVLGAVLLYFLLRTFTLVEIMGAGVVVAIFYGVALMPYYEALIDEFEDDYEDGELWSRLWPGFVVWVLLAVAVIVEWWTTNV